MAASSSHHLTTSRHAFFSASLPRTPTPALPRRTLPATFLGPASPCLRRTPFAAGAADKKKKAGWLDPFDDGEDPDMEYDALFAGGKQEEDPVPPEDPSNPYGFLQFPPGYNVEIASLASKVRGDVRRCCCVVAGGVYENLLFFPAIQLVKDRYPGVQVDIVTSARGKQCYEINKNVRWTDVFDPEDDFPMPAELTDMIGVLKNRYYDLIMSTKLAGIGHASFLFMTSSRDKVGYVYPNVNSVGAGLFMTETFRPPTTNLADGGYNMYSELVEWLGRPLKGIPRQPAPPLKVSISKKLKAYVEQKCTNVGVERGKYVVIHGIQSDSMANMKSRGDTDCLLPIQLWVEITKELRGVKPVYVIPHEREREDVEEIVGDDTSILFITTPGQLAALIDASAGVIATNTAAVQITIARNKPCIALFSSQSKADLFLPSTRSSSSCAVVSSRSGKLIDIEVAAVHKAMEVFERSPVLV